MGIYSLITAICVLFELVTGTIYSLTAFSPDQPIHGLAINAAGRAFYTGMNNTPATYCPEKVVSDCPPVLGTLVGDLLSGLAVSDPFFTVRCT